MPDPVLAAYSAVLVEKRAMGETAAASLVASIGEIYSSAYGERSQPKRRQA